MSDAKLLEITSQEYHSRSAMEVSHSELDCFIDSPKLYHGRYLADPPIYPREESDALTFGSCLHSFLLESKREWMTWRGGRRYGNDWDNFQIAAKGMPIIKPEEEETIYRISESIAGHEMAVKLLTGGASEVTIAWTDKETGVNCRARIDKLHENCIVDLKSARSANAKQFSRAAFDFGYHRQAAWYSDAVRELTGETLPFVFVACEKQAPYGVEVFELDERFVQLGRDQNRLALRRLAECRMEKQWENEGHGTIKIIAAPNWAYTDDQWNL